MNGMKLEEVIEDLGGTRCQLKFVVFPILNAIVILYSDIMIVDWENS